MKQLEIIEKIGYNNQNQCIEDCDCLIPIYLEHSQKAIIQFNVTHVLSLADYEDLVNCFTNALRCEVQLILNCTSNEYDRYYFRDYLNYFVDKGEINPFIKDLSYTLSNDILLISTQVQTQLNELNIILSALDTQFKMCGFAFSLDAQIAQEIEVEQIPVIRDLSPKVVSKSERENKVRYNKKAEFIQVQIKDLKEENHHVKFMAEVFKITERTINSGLKNEITYFVHDRQDAISFVQYIKLDEPVELKPNDLIMAYGSYIFDNYWRKNVFKLDHYEILEMPIQRYDDAKIKRSEFHTHTQASEMDGICDTKALIKQAYQFGFNSIAITDHAVVHNFPTAQRVEKELNSKDPEHQIKVVYGCEMNMVNDQLGIIKNAKNQPSLSDALTVVFDLETTGLASSKDEIIEFAAVKMLNGTVVDRKQLFIKPTQKIPYHIERLTNITNEMVQNAPSLADVFEDILDFIGDAILVAHNAVFDVRFLQAAAQKLNLPPLTNTIIDTLPLAWCLVENRRSFTLGSIARYYKIPYDQDAAHRGDYDTDVLCMVYTNLLKELKKRSVESAAQLVEFENSQTVFDKAREYHVTCLAKNQSGIKALYELVSLSHTEQLMFRGKSGKNEAESVAQARILRNDINRLRENLLIGSACFNSYLFEVARTGSLTELEQEVQFYDYIELQPLENYQPLVYRGNFDSLDEVVWVIERIIAVAKKYNKLIVASGDVHYVDPKDKIFREIYINAMGIGGVKHPLYIYDDNLRKTQMAPDQHLKTTNEMLAGFPYLTKQETYQIVVENSNKLSDLIEKVKPVRGELCPPILENSDQKLRDICYTTAYKKYGNPLPDIVGKRLERELDSIIGNGYGVVYYTSHLLVNKSNQDGYMVGSRGSVGSSLAATMAGITEVNPLVPHYVCEHCQHSEFFTNNEVASGFDLPDKECPHCHHTMHGDGQDIPFETFLGFEGDKVPDIDLNFSGDYQEVAHAFTKELFGEDKVLRAGTIGTIAEKTAFGLVSGYFESIGDFEEKNPVFKEYLASKAAGVKRSTGQHPGGIVVVPHDKDILDFVPYQYPANNPEASWMTTHFEYHDIENDVLKLDILGHVDPTCMKFLEEVSGLDVTKIPLNDKDTISIFSSVDALKIDESQYNETNGALGLPEFGTQFVRRMLNDAKPESFSDLIRISGLSHGTDVWNNNAADIIKDGLTLADVIACRDDIMTGLIAKGLPPKIAFTIMESVRKGKGLKPEWISQMQEKNVPQWYIDSALKIKYLFPKAHAVAYVMMGFRVAWFKVHRPLDFYAQYFTLRCDAYELKTMMGGVEVIKNRINDIRSRMGSKELSQRPTKKEETLISTLEVCLEFYLRGFHFTPLSFEHSMATQYWPDPNDAKALLMPFNSIDGLGDNIARNIIAARDEMPFISIEDLKKRTQINSAAINELKKLNVLDGLSETNQMSLF